MTRKIISIHSFRGGTGKSNTTANVAVQLGNMGLRVGVVDTDIQSPGIHVLFGLGSQDISRSLNDFLWNRCEITEAAYDTSIDLNIQAPGAVFLIPSSVEVDEIVNVLREGYDVSLLTDGFKRLLEELALDVLLIDTHPGLNEETLFSIAISNSLAVVMRPDHQDYEGTGVTVEVARSLGVPGIHLVVNKVPAAFDHDKVSSRVCDAYSLSDVTVIPHSDDLMNLASEGIFSVRFPHHPLTEQYRNLANALVNS